MSLTKTAVKISELEDIATETIQTETWKEQKTEKQ